MKKILAMALVCCALATFSVPAATFAEGERLNIVITIFPPYDFAKNIVGEHADVTMLLPPGNESHSFEPSPRDIIRMQEADVFIYIGGETDAWVDRILDSMDTSGMTILTLLDMVEAVPEEIVEGMEDSHDHEDEHDDHDEDEHGEDEDHDDHDHDEETELDEHVWTSPENAMAIVASLTDTLSGLDAANADTYRANADEYIAQLRELEEAFAETVASAARSTILFGDRFPFRYLADAFGLTYYAAFSGCSTDTEASATTIAFLIDKTIEEALPVVFKIEFSNGRIAETIAEGTGATVLEMHSCHNLSRQDFDAGVGYVDLMYKNVEALKEALN